MQSLKAVHPDDIGKVMIHVPEELQPVLTSFKGHQEKMVGEVFTGTMVRFILNLFSWLPQEQQSEILTACVTWFDIGLIMGNSPLRLAEMLEGTNSRLVDTEIPDWVSKALTIDHP